MAESHPLTQGRVCASIRSIVQTHSLGLYWHPVSLADKCSLHLCICMVYDRAEITFMFGYLEMF